jgi:hypothetical protein
MNEEIKKYIDEEIKKLEARIKGNFLVPYHIHNGIDAPSIPMNLRLVTTVPTASQGNNGDILLYESGGTRRLYGKINNVWYFATLT